MPHVGEAGPATRVRRATPGDLEPVAALLAEAGLPGDGVEAALATGCVAVAADGRILGAAAVERHGEVGLLRSVVVAESARGTGVGHDLVCCAEAVAGDAGIRELWLLTETAADWFPRLGYEPVARDDAPPAIAASHEFRVACAASAVLMRRSVAG